ncbi:MAG TPA: MOSC domain-containing protein [Blastocatellia bacterium]|nr:MOSC domain-containing protein [Blastocatellia bacterium]
MSAANRPFSAACLPKEEPRVISCNVGRPREIQLRGGAVWTGIFKFPVEGRVAVGALNLAGDEQADLSVHGGRDKAVYLYPSEHYQYWANELPQTEMPWGMFGENLTTKGLDERLLGIGDRLRIGSAFLKVTQPRMPCYKLALKFGLRDMVARFWNSGRSGVYLSVLDEGELGVRDTIEVIPAPSPSLAIGELLSFYTGKNPDPEILQRAMRSQDLPWSWKLALTERWEETRA